MQDNLSRTYLLNNDKNDAFTVKVVLWPKTTKKIFFSLDFKTMLTKD